MDIWSLAWVVLAVVVGLYCGVRVLVEEFDPNADSSVWEKAAAEFRAQGRAAQRRREVERMRSEKLAVGAACADD